ncbi:hypothetical protein WJX74_003845 [Apatococcus lobatus]|uniref:Uncharacterized protein n=1 Tax=Apatococcus lobatus TaxID=904363 RepID=A0AAW1SE49_9CHLO
MPGLQISWMKENAKPEVRFMNFDFSGREKEAFYPSFQNPRVPSPPGVASHQPMMQANSPSPAVTPSTSQASQSFAFPAMRKFGALQAVIALITKSVRLWMMAALDTGKAAVAAAMGDLLLHLDLLLLERPQSLEAHDRLEAIQETATELLCSATPLDTNPTNLATLVLALCLASSR